MNSKPCSGQAVCFARGHFFVSDHPIDCTCGISTSKFFLEPRKFCILQIQAIIQLAGFLQVLSTSSFEKLLLSTGLRQHAKMSTTLKTPDELKNVECKKGQLSIWPPIPYIPVVDIITPKEDPQVYKVKLPDDSHINLHIYSRGNNKEYLTHIVAVLHAIKQRGLDSRSGKLEKAVLRQSKMLKNLLDAAGSQDTVHQKCKAK